MYKFDVKLDKHSSILEFEASFPSLFFIKLDSFIILGSKAPMAQNDDAFFWWKMSTICTEYFLHACRFLPLWELWTHFNILVIPCQGQFWTTTNLYKRSEFSPIMPPCRSEIPYGFWFVGPDGLTMGEVDGSYNHLLQGRDRGGEPLLSHQIFPDMDIAVSVLVIEYSQRRN